MWDLIVSVPNYCLSFLLILEKRLHSIKQKTLCVRFQKFAVFSIKTAVLTQKSLYVDFNFFFMIIAI